MSRSSSTISAKGILFEERESSDFNVIFSLHWFILYLQRTRHMNLLHALHIDPSLPAPVISLVGAGGKTTALFQLAREYLHAGNKQVVVTTTTHLGASQISL